MYKLTLTNSIIRVSDGAFIPDDPGNRDRRAYQDWLAAFNIPQPADTSPPIPKVYITRLTIIDRLISVNKLTEALAAINADLVIQARWNAATEIAIDDPTALALCNAIGVDHAIILAP